MKSDAITKGYESITNKQRAMLYFHYVTNEDELEATRLLSSVPIQRYTMSDLEFIKWDDGLTRMAMVFAQEHWIARHGLMAALLQMKMAVTKKETPQKIESTFEAVDGWKKWLLSLDAALAAVAKQHGFDLLSVYIRARTVPFKPNVDDLSADTEVQAIWTETFNVILESSFE